jgi:2-polyprenyl-3-methyl-5-hydroxy-6-metoxy-1,4-benzoquinol methylase
MSWAEPLADISNPWDEYAEAFGQFVARREQADLSQDPIILSMLELLGDISSHEVLDACCGEGFFSRVLAAHGARVTAIDISTRLIDMAKQKDPNGLIDYRIEDLSKPLPELEDRFEFIASHLALNDVADYRAFADTLAKLAKPGGRLVLSFNNPYSFVVRGHISNYFESNTLGMYQGLSQMGVKAHFFHRTLEEYADAFLGAGFRLTRLVDVPDNIDLSSLLPEGTRFPRFMALAFEKT